MRRVVAVVLALALAGVGTFFLVRYVQGADDRALADKAVTSVLVVEQPIAAGTLAEAITDKVRLAQVLADSVATGAVDDLASLAGMVAAIDLLPGEQVLAGRFVTAEAYQESLGGPQVDVPADKLQVTLSLEPERVVGGEVKPGDLVAVFASFDPFDLNSFEPTGLPPGEIPVITTTTTLPGQEPQTNVGLPRTPNSTKIILHRVLVTNIQAEELPRTVPEGETPVPGSPALGPTGNLLITLALDPVGAERLVFTAEHGYVWLALEGSAVDQADTDVQTRNTVYEAQ